MTSALPIAVLVSGRGSNLEALIKARDTGSLPVTFALVASDHAHAPALRLAEEHGIATLGLDARTYATRRDYDLALFQRIQASGARLIVLAGFMRILDGAALAPWHGRVINIHPSLLPRYPGLHTHRRVLAASDRQHGASVHFVTAELDGGPVIAQAVIDVQAADDETSLAARLLTFEHQLLPAVVGMLAAGRIALHDNDVCLDGTPLGAPLQFRDGRLVVVG